MDAEALNQQGKRTGNQVEPRFLELLMAEDSEDDEMLIRDALREVGRLRVAACLRDGREVVRYLRQEGVYQHTRRPDLLLLDINMPLRNGFEVLATVKADAELAALPVVMMTTSKREEDVARSYAEGACSFLTKPTGYEELRETLRRFSSYWSEVSRVPAR